MYSKLADAIKERNRERTAAARSGKGYLILFVSHSSLGRYSGVQLQQANEGLKQMARSAECQAISLQIESEVLNPDSLPVDIDGPDAGLYVRFIWQLASSASSQNERVSLSAHACFERAHIEVKDVTADLERIFLLVFGD
ncbi:hypothetical protein [Pseudomonas putida]|uniref:hypothetical protein n=1 Tax=Pseudomonas putida TaxID=303 RepID=UPI00390598B8